MGDYSTYFIIGKKALIKKVYDKSQQSASIVE